MTQAALFSELAPERQPSKGRRKGFNFTMRLPLDQRRQLTAMAKGDRQRELGSWMRQTLLVVVPALRTTLTSARDLIENWDAPDLSQLEREERRTRVLKAIDRVLGKRVQQ